VHGLRSPQRKSVDWSTGPRATGLAMAVAHAFGFARDLNLNCPTETSTFVHHRSPRFALLSAAYWLAGKKKPNLVVCHIPAG
jgi:hypothetical protein